ncbi:MAG: TonB-dependent receptor [Spirosomataceae bacterium]
MNYTFQYIPFKSWKIASVAAIVVLTSSAAIAQNKGEGTVQDEEVTIEKNRKITLPPANRIFDKIPSPKANTESQKQTYSFVERKLNVGASKFNPVISPFQNDGKIENGYDNYVRLGGGNFGRIFGEAFLTSPTENDGVLNLYAKHNSSSQGPVDDKNSANNEQVIKLNAKYLTNDFKLFGSLGFDREQFYFYGYKQKATPIERETIQQILNKYSFNVGIENAKNDASIDYGLKTGITFLKDHYTASELDWGTKFNASFVINQNFLSNLDAVAHVTQREDGITDNRNWFQVKPSFTYKTSTFNVSLALNAVVESDKRRSLSRTMGFPVINVDFTPLQGVHIFAGMDGTIERNTLTELLAENRWLAPQANLKNTELTRQFYVGTKGALGSGFNYEAKISYGQYKDFYVFANAKADSSKLVVLYDSLKTSVTSVVGQLNYQQEDFWRSFLKVEYYNYNMGSLEKAFSRPNLKISWNNTLVFKQKLFLTTDVYLLSGIYGKNFATNQTVKLNSIVDLNAKMTYQLTDQLSAFVSMNNILGKNYERYLYYKQQGLNFLLGLSFSF